MYKSMYVVQVCTVRCPIPRIGLKAVNAIGAEASAEASAAHRTNVQEELLKINRRQ